MFHFSYFNLLDGNWIIVSSSCAAYKASQSPFLPVAFSVPIDECVLAISQLHMHFMTLAFINIGESSFTNFYTLIPLIESS